MEWRRLDSTFGRAFFESTIRSVLAMLAVGLPGCSVDAETPRPARPEAAVEAIGNLRTELGRALKTALVEGPTHAIEFCRLEAPGITARQYREGVRVGRTSDRLRNPANAPEEWMIPLLEEFQGRPPEPGAFATVDLGTRGTGYVEPIYLKPLCATCHGQSISPALQATLREHYPQDRATGFRVGELRGLFWAVVARESETAP